MRLPNGVHLYANTTPAATKKATTNTQTPISPGFPLHEPRESLPLCCCRLPRFAGCLRFSCLYRCYVLTVLLRVNTAGPLTTRGLGECVSPCEIRAKKSKHAALIHWSRRSQQLVKNRDSKVKHVKKLKYTLPLKVQ